MTHPQSIQFDGKVLVVGGGMGGIRTALDLAESGRNVVLVDKAVSIGGLMTQLDRTFPTNNCDLCTLSPNLSEAGRAQRIDLRTMTQVEAATGDQGAFEVTLTTTPRHIDLDRCTACGDCLRDHPECVSFTPGLDHRAPTCMRYPHAIPQAYSIDLERCADVDALVKTCPAGAIIPDDTRTTVTETFGAIVLAPGAEVYDPSPLAALGYSLQPDVVTSLEYERILSASGPTGGKLLRPSNGQPPKKVAWLQCVGSRARQAGHGVSYCSSACCMFAIKEAMVTKERFGADIETTIFNMDIRTSGKGYEAYYQRSKDTDGVRFVRCRTQNLQADESCCLQLRYLPEESDTFVTEGFDMVVLATGFFIPEDIRTLAEQLKVDVNGHGFALTDSFHPVSTSRAGVYVAGLFEGPKDIPETMVQASAAACMAATHVAPTPDATPEEELPPERTVDDEPVRTGVFVCACGENIGGVVDVDSLVSHAKTLDGVVHSENVGYGCSAESMEHIRETIAGQGLNRVVIGGCSPRTHLTRFQDLLRKAGLNRYLVDIANLRDQDAWVHRDAPEMATAKGKELLQMGVAAVKRAKPLADQTLPMSQNVLVVGGGVAGMSAALSLAGQGFKVHLAERENELGGEAKNLRRTLEGEDVRTQIEHLVAATESHENIQVYKGALIVDHSGLPGKFTTGMQVGPQLFYRQIEHGATVLATGALANRPSVYLLGEHDAVSTQHDIESLLEEDTDTVGGWSKIVMIQCAGSRTKENPACSRVCCQSSIKNALRILDVNPAARIWVLYRDMRTLGMQEDAYQEARRRGVLFVRYDPENPPQVEGIDDKVKVTFHDPILADDLSMHADRVLLSTGFVADDEGTEELSRIFRLPRTEDGYLLEDHTKLRPVDLPTLGFYVAGTAHSPKSIKESVAQAQAAASRVQTLLARGEINLGAAVARVDASRCAACLVCVRACPYGVPFINADGDSEIDPALCHGCGICAAECPAKAIQLQQFDDDQILAKLEGLLERRTA
jgi:heterodisulfide reductase subunit A2